MSRVNEALLEISGLTRRFGPEDVLRDVSFHLHDQQVLAVVGRSGCGKTTLLKIIAGLLPADEGVIRRRGTDITSLPAEKRDIVYLYQEPLLFPHLTVFENVAFGLRLRGVAAGQIQREVTHMIESLGLLDHRDKAPHQLSGGQKQRVSFGRALILAPAVLLLDEPFSSLDADSRAQMQALFKRVAVEYAITAVFVTHDLKEALILGDTLSTLRDGRLRVYESKAEFIADPLGGVAEEVAFWRALGDEKTGPAGS